MSTKSLPYITLLAFFFGTTLVVSRFSVGQFDPLTYVGLRLLIAGLCFVIIYIISSKRKLPKETSLWKHSAVLGVFATAVPMTLIVSSLQYQSSGVASLFLTVSPAITVIMAHFLLADERLNLQKSIGVSMAVGGAVLLAALGESGLPNVSRADPKGYIMVITAILFGSSMTIYTRKYMREFDWFEVTSVRIWIAALLIFPLSLILVGFDLSRVTIQGFSGLFYAALIGTFSGMTLVFYNIKRFGATATAMTDNLIPIVAILGGALFLGETITTGMIAGMVLILSGLMILNQREVTTSQITSD